MKRPPAAPRSELRIADLKARGPGAARTLNVNLPRPLADAINELAGRLKTSRQSVMVALLNKALEVAGRKVRKSS